MSRMLLVAACLMAVPAFAAPATNEQIQDWIRDLDHSKFRVRDAAAGRLREAGVDAAPFLAKAARNGSTETSDRALRLLGDMFEGTDARAQAAARRQLRRLADGESVAANDARLILGQKRNRILAQLLFAGVAYQELPEGITSIDLDNCTDLDVIVPLLKEFPEVEYLSISSRKFTSALAVHLTELPNLRDLNLYRSGISDEGLKQLVGLKNLRRIPMGESKITDAGLKIISVMTQLEYVGVRGDDVTDAGLIHLKNLTKLTGLYLGETKITDDGLKHLAPLTKLKEIYLHTTGITDAGLEHLGNFKDLRYVYLSKTKTTETGRARLKEALPDLTIYDDSNR